MSRTTSTRVVRVVRKNRHVVGQVADTRKQEEQERDPLGTFSLVIEQELRYPRGQVKRRTQISEHLAEEVEFHEARVAVASVFLVAVFVMAVSMVGRARRQPPTQYTRQTHDNNGRGIEQHGLHRRGRLHGRDCSQVVMLLRVQRRDR